MTLYASGCLWCLSMYKLCLVAPTHFYGCSRWPLTQLDAQDGHRCSLMYLLVAWCTWMSWMSWCTNTFLWMPKMTLDAQDDPRCSWMSWMSINTQVLPWCTKGFIWMLKMTLDAAVCLGCLSMYKLCLVAPHIFLDAPDDPWCSWMSWMSINTQVLPWCIKGFIWMLKITFNVSGIL